MGRTEIPMAVGRVPGKMPILYPEINRKPTGVICEICGGKAVYHAIIEEEKIDVCRSCFNAVES